LRENSGATVSYLALGDSLSVGFQPNRGKTTEGYVDDLWRRVRQQIPALALRKVGCAGETSRSMITGINSPCHYAAGSQLNAAIAFLEAHPEQVAFITIDVGANDIVNRCLADTFKFVKKCAVDLIPRLQTRVMFIVSALRTAAGPGVPIVAMNYYNPFLGLWVAATNGRALARADQRVWTEFNAGLEGAYRNAGAHVADVAATFRIADFKDYVGLPDGERIPVNVARACTWTWFCSPRFFGDPHANQTGYRKVARTFVGVLKGL
jgi:lysophospholipase L1-like esterase